MTINDNQRRAVGTTLRLLEERLANIQRIAEEDETAVLYRRVSPLTAAQRQQIREHARAIRGLVRRAAASFDLPCEERSATPYILASLALCWESLEDIRPDKLSGYGDVDPGLVESLAPILERLIGLILDLEKVVKEPG